MKVTNLAVFNKPCSPISIDSFNNFINNENCFIESNNIQFAAFVKNLNHRVAYVFQELKRITQSNIENFNYINCYDNNENLGFFDIKEFSNEITFSGEFSDAYSKPFGNCFPTSFLFNDFEFFASNIYQKFLNEKESIFNFNNTPNKLIKEFSYPKEILSFK